MKRVHISRTVSYSVLSVLVVTVLAITAVMNASPALAAPTPTLFAGTGTDGPLVNDIPATTAQLWGPSDVEVASDGTVYIADTYHHQIRKVGADGIIRAALGTGAPNCIADGANTTLWQPRGLDSDSAGNLYVANTLCNLVLKMAPDGTVTVLAGRNTGFYTTIITNGMPATQAYLTQPSDLDYDEATGALYIADQYSSRILKVFNGGISVVAGNANPGFTGDGVAATSTRLNYPRSVLFADGILYIGDTSNCRVRAVGADGIIATIAGSGSCNDSGAGGPAVAAGFSSVGDIAFGADGKLYIGSATSGRIRAYDFTSQIIEPVTELFAGVGGLSFTASGDLMAVGGAHKVYKITGLAPPPVLPTVVKIQPAEPLASDAILTRGVEIFPLINGAEIDYFEYGWSSDPDATEPGSQLQTSTELIGRLDYRATTPNADWYLFARAVSPGGIAGPWSPPTTVHTPPTPLLIVGGDSISSGHHLEFGEPGPTCQDGAYGYPGKLAEDWLQEQLPAAWEADAYQNYAYSGFSILPRPNAATGSMTGGGNTACGEPVTFAPLSKITAELIEHRGSWNRFVGTFGINDTNWNAALVRTAAALGVAQNAPEFIRPLLQRVACTTGMRTWDGNSSTMRASITAGAQQVVTALQAADPLARIDIQSYYNIAGTGFIPAVCTETFANAIGSLHTAIQAGVSESPTTQFNDISSVMDGRGDRMQPLISGQITLEAVRLTGWPHPNQDGALAIAGLIPN